MLENCTIRTKTGIKERFGSLLNAINIANKYRNEPLTYRQITYQPEELTEEWALFWSQVAFYEQRQINLCNIRESEHD